jgi:hypothetical protein
VPLPPMSSMVPVDLSVDLTTPTDPPPEPYQEGSYPGQPNIPVSRSVSFLKSARGLLCSHILRVALYFSHRHGHLRHFNDEAWCC